MRRTGTLALASAAAAVFLAGCGSDGRDPSSGSVDVLYAGSLVSVMQQRIGPDFTSTTGYAVTGFSAGSTALATQIKGKVHRGDVFISAGPDVNASLEGAGNGGWVSWYGTFASSALVLGYNPASRFADDLRTKPWYQVITEPGFRLGRTDPGTDPKGTLAARALTDTATRQRQPDLTALASDTSGVYPEETLVGRLQAGQLDAGFFYASEAASAGIATVPLTGEDLQARYTVTILRRAPHEKAAEAFVTYLLGAQGRAALHASGFTLVRPPVVTGSGVPAGLRAVLGH